MNKTQIYGKLTRDFDFEKIRYVMDSLNWEWTPIGRVPSVSDMKRTVKDLIDILLKDDAFTVACGGFELTRAIENDGDTVFILKFIVDQAYTFEDD